MGKLLYKKEYGYPDVRLSMRYLMRKDTDERTPLYVAEAYRRPEEAETEMMTGVFCTKCGEFHEYSEDVLVKAERENRSVLTCGCGDPFSERNCFNVNCSALTRRTSARIHDAFPVKLEITEHGDSIHLSVVGRNYYLNPKAMKPYSTVFQITVVINVSSGQTYIMPAQNRGKKVFADIQAIRRASFSYNPIIMRISKTFLEADPEAMNALEKAFKRLTPAVKSELGSLMEVAYANFLKELYDLRPKEDHDRFYGEPPVGYIYSDSYKKLRARYRKDPYTFPKYLYYGCGKVATKSIRKILYARPVLKWRLRFLHKTLGISNVDIIREYLTDETDYIDNLIYEWQQFADREHMVANLATACRNAGMSDRKIAELFISREVSFYILRDTARMYDLCPITAEELKACRTMTELHNVLVEIELLNKDKLIYKQYGTEVSYDETIYALEGEYGGAEFTVIKQPLELRALGRRFHNCVGSYMEDVKRKQSVIVEMTIGNKPAGCIELDPSGSSCRQAFAACNKPLEGVASDSFNAWTKKHNIKFDGQQYPRANHFENVVPAFDDFGGFRFAFDAIPF